MRSVVLSFHRSLATLLLMGLIAVASACSGATATPTSPPTETRLPAAPAQDAPAGEAAPTPTLRPQLEASDPASFQRASGQVQLVEFFAYW